MATRSRPQAEPAAPTAAELRRLKLSPEVAWYLISREIAMPTCVPKIKTPEPGEVDKTAVFDAARVDRVMLAFSLLRHTKGQWQGEPLIPAPWQVAYLIAPTFGWVHKNDYGEYVRVIRELYCDVPRRNGKSTICGGIAMYLTAADGEGSAEVVAAATTTNQASIVFDPIKQLAQSAPALKGHVKALQHRIVHPASGSFFAVVSSSASAQHGRNLHGAIIDELHLHKTPDLVEALETGTGSRRQPLIVKITTADDGKPNTVYARTRTYVEQLASRAFVAPSTYGVVFAADEDDDPFAESTWRKANPGYGVSPSRESLKADSDKARNSPAEMASFLRLHLGLRTKQDARYLSLAVWDRNASIVEEVRLAGREAYGGLDLASTSDLCALCWVFPDAAGGADAIWRLWAPSAAIEALDRRTAGSASAWVRSGLLTLTPGDVCDYDYIKQAIRADSAAFAVQELAYDRWNATQLVNDLLAEDVPMRPMGQGFASMSAPTKELQRLILLGTAEKPKLRHGGNPSVRWQIDNFAVAMDPAGNVKPNKANAHDKIDAVVALIMALDSAAQAMETGSIYDERDPIVV